MGKFKSVVFVLLAMSSSLGFAKSSPPATESFKALQREIAAARSTTMDGRPQSYVLSGEACRSQLSHKKGQRQPSTSTWQWAKVEAESVGIFVPLVVISDDEGPAEILFNSEEQADRVVSLVTKLRQQCAGK